MVGTKKQLLTLVFLLILPPCVYGQTQMSGTVNVRSVLNPINVISREDTPAGSAAVGQFSTPILAKVTARPVIYQDGTLQHLQLDFFGRLRTYASLADVVTRAPSIKDPALVTILSPIPNPKCPNPLGFSQTASTQQITSNGQQIFLCTVAFISAGAQNVSIVSGTGATCGTNTSPIVGGSTASLAVAANGGMALPATDIQFQVKQGDNVCVLQSAANNVSGTITYTTRMP